LAEQLSLFAPRASWLHRLHPVTKLALAAFMLSAGLLLPGVWLTYLFLGAVLFPIAATGQVLRPLLRAIGPVVVPFALSVFIIQGVIRAGGTPIAALGPLSLKREGLLFAFASVGRLSVVVGAFMLFALTTRPDVLMIGLTQRGTPPALAYIVVATIQLVPRLRQRAAAILEAQQARGLETGGSLLRRARALMPLMTPLVLSSLVDVEERALAIEARAFNHPGKKTSLIEVSEAAGERPARWLLLLGCASLAAARLLIF
jgi:energy-coupling factor transport system permease protein